MPSLSFLRYILSLCNMHLCTTFEMLPGSRFLDTGHNYHSIVFYALPKFLVCILQGVLHKQAIAYFCVVDFVTVQYASGSQLNAGAQKPGLEPGQNDSSIFLHIWHKLSCAV